MSKWTIDAKATGENIRKRCDDAGLTPEYLSRVLNLDLSTLYYWFQGKSLPRWEVAVVLADMLKCHLDDLIVTVVEQDEEEENVQG